MEGIKKITVEHFTIFRDSETVQIILEDSFGVIPERDEIFIPFQDEVLRIISTCPSLKGGSPERNVNLFANQDKAMRLRSLIWFIYLAIEVATVEWDACSKNGVPYFRKKFRQLLNHTIDGTIINEESRTPGFEGGKWERTLFGWLQGEDRKHFVEKLKRQFNMENKIEHVNRRLLAKHREHVFKRVLSLCPSQEFGRNQG
jgi:hypothetical protein